MIIQRDKTVNGQKVPYWEIQNINILLRDESIELGFNGYINYVEGGDENYIFATETIKVPYKLGSEIENLITNIIRNYDKESNKVK